MQHIFGETNKLPLFVQGRIQRQKGNILGEAHSFYLSSYLGVNHPLQSAFKGRLYLIHREKKDWGRGKEGGKAGK